MTVILTSRLVLRPLCAADFRRWEAFYATPRSRFLGGPLSRAERWEAFSRALRHWRSRGFGDWMIEDRATGAFLGGVSLEWREGWPAPELGWFLIKTATGAGFAAEAAAALRDHAFGPLGLRRVVSFIDAADAASAAVARRLGAAPDRAIRAPGGGAALWRHRPAETLGAVSGPIPDLGSGAWFDHGRNAA